MSIYGAMYSGVSGLAAQSQALGIISDNISNANTVGYKGSNARFQTLVTEAASASAYAPGGVRSQPYQKIDRQGLLQNSSSPTDLAITGNGFFVVNEAASPQMGDTYMFTRAGNFEADNNGKLMSAGGYYLQGWRLDNQGNLPAQRTQLSDLQTVDVSNLTGSAQPTTQIGVGLNLPAQAAVTDTFGSSLQLFDKQGTDQNLELTWTKTATNTWTLSGTIPGTARFASNDTAAAALGAGPTTLMTMTFNADGTIASVAGNAPYGTVNADNQLQFYVDYDNAAATTSTQDRQLVTVDVGDMNSGNGITQYAGTFFTTVVNQDGRSLGAYSGIRINGDGIVTAMFDNGQMKDIYKLPIAVFNNPNGLERQSGNAYFQNNVSGEALLLEANTVGAGQIAPSSLENSNVDLAEEFTNMIISQRAYSANSKVITTADEMLEQLINIRR